VADEAAGGSAPFRTSIPPRAHDVAEMSSWLPAPFDRLSVAPPAPIEDGFASAWEDAVRAMLLRDHLVAREALQRCKAIRPGDPAVEANLSRLEALGAQEKP
jgi:hypothetical protein